MKNLKITVNGTEYDVQVKEAGSADASYVPSPEKAETAPAPSAVPAPAPSQAASPAGAGGETVESPMPGTILSVNVNAGDTVKEGDTLLILEAMKMENEIMAPKAGKILAVQVTKGQAVESGTPLVTIG